MRPIGWLAHVRSRTPVCGRRWLSVVVAVVFPCRRLVAVRLGNAARVLVCQALVSVMSTSMGIPSPGVTSSSIQASTAQYRSS